jgi:nitric oxide reductase NorD protein
MPVTISQQFSTFFTDFVDLPSAESLAHRLALLPRSSELLSLLIELRDSSRKNTIAVVNVLPDLLEVLTPTDLIMWLDVAVAFSERSGATLLKYCQASVALLRDLSSHAHGPALRLTRELIEQDAAFALEVLRQSSQVINASGVGMLATWAQIGADLAKCDYVLGIEYVRRSSMALEMMSLEDLKIWAGVSLRLVTPNSLGKPDYMTALTYLRTSLMLIGDVQSRDVRHRVIRLTAALADRDPAWAIQFLGEAPGRIHAIHSPEWQQRVLAAAMLVGQKDAEAAVGYLRQAPEIIILTGGYDLPSQPLSEERFQTWLTGGLEALDYSTQAGRAYFSAETRSALQAIESATSGVAVREIVRVLKFFAEGLSGRRITIQADENSDRAFAHSSKRCPGEYVIHLPARLRRYPTREENLRLYRIMTAHEAGHVEYGTYDLDVRRLDDIAAQACLRYGRPPRPQLQGLDDLFQCYPYPALIRDLWLLAEDARIETSLKAEYPGLRRDLDAAAREEVSRRSLAHGLSAKEMAVELLVQLSGGVPEQVRIPFALEEVVTRAWALLQTVAQPHASAEAVVRAAHRAYVLIDELTAASERQESDAISQDTGSSSSPAGEAQGGDYHPVSNFEFRGAVTAEQLGLDEGLEPMPQGGTFEPALKSDTTAGQDDDRSPVRSVSDETAVFIGRRESSAPDPLQYSSGGPNEPVHGERNQDTFLYDEWDATIRDYRNGWCYVQERIGAEGTEEFVDQTRRAYGGAIRLLRRYFEAMRSPALRRMRRRLDGEEVDMEAAIEREIERHAETSPAECVYIRRDRRDRDVATAFLMDLSGSTGRPIGDEAARIIDIEKEALVLMAEALEAVGDQYALYGYSGQSRRDVQVVKIKDFDERYVSVVWRRLDAVQPLIQNRDGAAIRHVVRRLSARTARVKLLVLLSDGRPLDDLYHDDYALEDTKAALREAKAQGVHVFCVTVDRGGSQYLARMYGDVAYVVIDRAQALPERLPRIYRVLTT